MVCKELRACGCRERASVCLFGVGSCVDLTRRRDLAYSRLTNIARHSSVEGTCSSSVSQVIEKQASHFLVTTSQLTSADVQGEEV